MSSFHSVPESFSGWLLKQSRGDIFFKNWRKRYMTLEAGKLVYFVDCKVHNGITIGADRKGELNLENAKVFKGSGTGNFMHKNSDKQLYVVAGTDEHNLYLEAPSVDEMCEWMHAFEEHARFATMHPCMVPKLERGLSGSSSVAEESLEHVDRSSSRSQHHAASPEDMRFSNDILKTTITPTLYGLLLKTRDESSNTTVFVSVVSHPMCHDHVPLGAHNVLGTSPQPLAIVNPNCWYFSKSIDYTRRTTAKLGLRQYCEPALVKDGDSYVVFQVLIGLDIFHSLWQEIQDTREARSEATHEIVVNPQCTVFIELQKMFMIISTALSESHQVSCHKHFSVIEVEEEEYEPFFVSPMEVIIGRNEQTNQISFFTTVDNIQRNTESFIPVPGVQLCIRGRGVVPPKTVKEDINVIINLHSHAVCDQMRDIQQYGRSSDNNITSSHLKASSQRDLNHTLEECSKAIFLWGEAVHHTDATGLEYYSYDVTTNTTIIRLCKLDNFDRQQLHTMHASETSSTTSSFSNSTATGPGITDIVTMYLLQSLTRYFDVKLSGHTSSMSDFGDPAFPLSSLSSNLGNDDVVIKPVKIIKFSFKTRICSPLFAKEKHISNDYDNIDDDDFADDDFADDYFEYKANRFSMSHIYSNNSFSLVSDDILFTDIEFYKCKLKEMTTKGSNILDALEDELADISKMSMEIDSVSCNKHHCVSYVVTSDLPTYVLDYPMTVKVNRDASATMSKEGFDISPPAVVTKLHTGAKINVFCIKEFPNAPSWLLVNSGWIPSSSCECDSAVQFQLPTEVVLLQQNSEETGQGTEYVLIECQFQSSLCKGKSIAFRRHFKSYLSKLNLNPFSYDKSSDNYTALPIIRLLRLRSSLDGVLSELKSFFDLDEWQESYSISQTQEFMNRVLHSKDERVVSALRSFFTPTKEDWTVTENHLKCRDE